MNKTLLSFGHGYTARALAAELLAEGWQITGTTRSADKAEALRATGVTPAIFPGTMPPLDGVSHLLISAGPDAEGDPVLREIGEQISARARQFAWVGYLSTTGVYGDHQGGWVDETTPLHPSTRRGQWRKAAEEAWSAIPDLPLHIFRLAGIYGPGRGALEKVRQGSARRIIKPGQVFSRTHVDDIAQVLRASIAQPNPGAVYNVCDDDPAPPQDIIEEAARLLGLPIPPDEPFETAEMSPMMRSFYADSKKVRNDRIKDELGVVLKYPTYRQVLAAMVTEAGGSAD
ncbi:MAG: SDR family oxidoreductase [Rhodobacteraceae bacterium]|nr:SDR family oxidoreductase [Paracoccaceae bacterium]